MFCLSSPYIGIWLWDDSHCSKAKPFFLTSMLSSKEQDFLKKLVTLIAILISNTSRSISWKYNNTRTGAISPFFSPFYSTPEENKNTLPPHAPQNPQGVELFKGDESATLMYRLRKWFLYSIESAYLPRSALQTICGCFCNYCYGIESSHLFSSLHCLWDYQEGPSVGDQV